ncbi:MAG: transposase [Ruminococcaceae bacterium]|nr:transposase [Oscillospiraceae bacterium]
MPLKTRKPNRLPDYDYSQNGAYFITICTKDSKSTLSQIAEDTSVGATCGRPKIILTKIGEIIEDEIKRLNTVYCGVKVDNYVVMPNHIHLIISINIENGRPQVAPTISRAIQQFKGKVTKTAKQPVWQKGFHDHVIRDEEDYLTRWQYIDENPRKWLIGKDEYYSL